MTRRPNAFLVACGATVLTLIVAVSLSTEVSAANKTSKANKRPIKNPKFDPNAEQIDLFEAVDAGRVTVKLTPNDAMGGNVLIENKTDKPLTVKIPDAVIGASIHAQFGGMGGGMGGMGGGMGGMGGGMGGGGGGQMMGGGMGGMGGGMGGMGGGMGGMGGGGMGGMGGGGGFFSIPPEKVVSIPFNSVCLEHGKPEPNSTSRYTLYPVSRVSKDPVLYQLLAAVGTKKADPQAAQAAAWHLANRMSFDELAEKTDSPNGSITPEPYFSREQLLAAQQMIAMATERAAEEKTPNKTEQVVQPRTTSANATSAKKPRVDNN